MFNQIEKLYIDLCPDTPLSSKEFDHELDRRSAVISAVAECIKNEYDCAHAPQLPLAVQPHGDFFNALAHVVGEGSSSQWGIKLPPIFWLKPQEITLVGDAVKLPQETANWFSAHECGPFTLTAGEQALLSQQDPPELVWYTVGYLLGRHELGHLFEEQKNSDRRIAAGTGIAVGVAFTLGSLAGLFALYPSFLLDYSGTITTGVIGGITVGVTSELARHLIYSALLRRRKLALDAFAAQRPEGARGGLCFWEREVSGFKAHLGEAIGFLIDGTPTMRQRRAVFETALPPLSIASLHSQTQSADAKPSSAHPKHD
jgi:hypothetical protein